MERSSLDEAYLPFAEFSSDLANLDGMILDDEEQLSMVVDEVTCDMPVEMDILIDKDGKVEIGAAAPLYYLETSFVPVFHQLKVKLIKKNCE
jgi:hypothetical protein